MSHSVIVEMRPRLQVCNVFLILKEFLDKNESLKINVKVSGMDVTWKTQNGEIMQVINLQDYKLKPLSLTGLQVQKNSVSFRIQTEPITNISGSLASEVLPFTKNLCTGKSDSFIIPAPNISVNEPYQILCKCCGNIISNKSIVFKRILPLPSCGSLDISDWFCHQHDSNTDMKIGSLIPQETDCLYGLSFILLRVSLLTVEKSQVIVCSKCLSWLGTCLESTAKLWDCTVSYGGKNVTSTALEDLKLTITKAVKESLTMTCRIMLETKVSEDDSQFLLLWIMDKELDVHVNSENSSSDDSKCVFECNLKARKMMKLLYLYQSEVNDIVKSWQNDINVQCIEVAKQMLVEGLEYFMKGTNCIPDAYKIANDFFVSYMAL